MRPVDVIKAIFLPVTSPAVLLALFMFWVIMCIGTSGSPLGVVVLILGLPPLFRYKIILLEATARGREPGAFDAEFFNWSGGLWSLFPLPVVIGLLLLGVKASQAFGIGGVYLTLVIAGALLPASFAVLAITHSPLQSLNPVAIGRLLKTTGQTFWIASLYLFLLGWGVLEAERLPNLVGNFLQLFALFSFASLTGALIAPYSLVDDLHIPDALEASEEDKLAGVAKHRTAVLGHAYGFISRGNRESGFAHIFKYLEEDPDVVGAWRWFFERMLKWEQPQHALFFAQHYIKDLLRHGDDVPAIKVTLRCRMLNEQFRPFREDIPAMINAAERSGNIELASVLKRV